MTAEEGEERTSSDHLQPKQDRVENAFKKFDLDQDGFLSWHEFKQVNHVLIILSNVPTCPSL